MDEEAPTQHVEEEDGAKDAKEGWELFPAKFEVLFQRSLLAHRRSPDLDANRLQEGEPTGWR